jgi:peroxiredoxin
MEGLEAAFERFSKANTTALGTGCDSAPCNKAWAKSMNLTKTRLLADFWPHGAGAVAFGMFRGNDGFSERANILIDEKGIVKWVKVYPLDRVPDLEEVFKAING